jgi:hypothetical protein
MGLALSQRTHLEVARRQKQPHPRRHAQPATDIYSPLDQELGHRYAYAIDHSPKADKQLRQAADLLRSWDGVMNANSAAGGRHHCRAPGFLAHPSQAQARRRLASLSWSEKAFVEEELVTHSPRNGSHPATRTGTSCSPPS